MLNWRHTGISSQDQQRQEGPCSHRSSQIFMPIQPIHKSHWEGDFSWSHGNWEAVAQTLLGSRWPARDGTTEMFCCTGRNSFLLSDFCHLLPIGQTLCNIPRKYRQVCDLSITRLCIYVCTMDLYVLFERCLLSTIIVLIIVIFPQKTRDGGQDALLVGRVHFFFFLIFLNFGHPQKESWWEGSIFFCFFCFFWFFWFFWILAIPEIQKNQKNKKKIGLLFFCFFWFFWILAILKKKAGGKGPFFFVFFFFDFFDFFEFWPSRKFKKIKKIKKKLALYFFCFFWFFWILAILKKKAGGKGPFFFWFFCFFWFFWFFWILAIPEIQKNQKNQKKLAFYFFWFFWFFWILAILKKKAGGKGPFFFDFFVFFEFPGRSKLKKNQKKNPPAPVGAKGRVFPEALATGSFS